MTLLHRESRTVARSPVAEFVSDRSTVRVFESREGGWSVSLRFCGETHWRDGSTAVDAAADAVWSWMLLDPPLPFETVTGLIRWAVRQSKDEKELEW